MGGENMSKIKRYKPSKIVFHFSGGEESCPNPMCEAEDGQYVRYNAVAALEARVMELNDQLTMSLKDFDKLTTDRNNLLVQVQEAKDKLKAAEAWKERAIEWLTKNPCHFIRGRDTTPHDCRTCIEAYFAEDKP
jgi:hypothetical protein